MESESDLRRLEDINKDKEEDEKKTQELKEAFARIANTKNRFLPRTISIAVIIFN